MWVTTVTYALELGEKDFERLADQLEQLDATVADIPGHGVDVTLWDDATDALDAAAAARDRIAHIMVADPVAVEVVHEPEYERRADAPTLPELVSAPQVAELLGGVSRQRVHQLRTQPSFPKPLFELRTGPIWDARAIRRFGREWPRKPGRPAKTAS